VRRVDDAHAAFDPLRRRLVAEGVAAVGVLDAVRTGGRRTEERQRHVNYFFVYLLSTKSLTIS